MGKILITTSKLISLNIDIKLFKDRLFLERVNNGILETKISKVYKSQLKKFNNKNIKFYLDETINLCNSLYLFESK